MLPEPEPSAGSVSIAREIRAAAVHWWVWLRVVRELWRAGRSAVRERSIRLSRSSGGRRGRDGGGGDDDGDMICLVAFGCLGMMVLVR